MISKPFTHEKFEKLFKYVYLLNVSDILLTLLLLQTGCFKEANPMMIRLVESPVLAIAIKTIVPLLVIIYMLWRVRQVKWNPSMVRYLKLGAYTCFYFYLFVNIMHLFYLATYLVFVL